MLRARALHTFGLGESDLAERLGDVLSRGHFGETLDVGTTASRGVVSVRCYARADTSEAADAALDDVEATVRDRLGHVVFGNDDDTLPSAVVACLRTHGHGAMLSTAESCTGGLIAKLMTDIAGSSDVFRRSFVTYTNESKTELLGVPTRLLEQHGAVSTAVAEAMAKGAAGDGFAVSVTGVAGPGGGSDEKPVGTVCIGLAGARRDGRVAPVQLPRRPRDGPPA